MNNLLRKLRQFFCRHRYDSLEPIPGLKNVDGYLLPIYKCTCRKCGLTRVGTMLDLVRGYKL